MNAVIATDHQGARTHTHTPTGRALKIPTVALKITKIACCRLFFSFCSQLDLVRFFSSADEGAQLSSHAAEGLKLRRSTATAGSGRS